VKVLSLFSGAGGLDLGLERAGHTIVAQCEIDPTARQVLARHWPDTHLHDDVTQLSGAEVLEACGPIDMVVGGFPCQDLSVAGKRAGLAGARSGLFWDALRVTQEVDAEWLLLENVAGLLSSNEGEDFRMVMDAIEDAGYMADPNIYDARFFGVPQRRRRVFITCRLASKAVTESTPRSSLTMAQVLAELWLLALASVRGTSASVPPPWDSPSACADGLRRRMKLFGLGTPEEPNFEKWLPNLAVDHLSAATDGGAYQTSGGAQHRDTGTRPTEGKSSDTTPTPTDGERFGSWPTGLQWRTFLDDLSELVKLSTISTATSETTERTICTSSLTLPLICEGIAALTPLCPDCWQPASSASTANEVCTSYAIKASGELTSYMDWVHDVNHVLARSERASDALRSARGGCGPEVLLEPEGVRGNPEPSRTPGTVVAAITARGVGTCGADDNLNLTPYARQLTTGGGKPGQGYGAVLSFNWQGAAEQGADVQTQRTGSLSTTRVPAVHAPDLAVRRLTPRECERLMGWPDDHTRYRADGTEIADSHRYRLCGNGVVAQVAEWIGRRLP
jgi:site-specific DNA-cytosine methylase